MTDHLKPLRLALHGMDSRHVTMLMLFLKGPCKGEAVVVNSPEDADANVFDADVPESLKLLTAHLKQELQKPAIVLTLQNFSLEQVLYVKKPVQTGDMLRVLNEAKKLASELAKKKEALDKLVPVSTAANDLFDFFNDELFHYLASSKWEDDPVPDLSDERQTIHTTNLSHHEDSIVFSQATLLSGSDSFAQESAAIEFSKQEEIDRKDEADEFNESQADNTGNSVPPSPISSESVLPVDGEVKESNQALNDSHEPNLKNYVIDLELSKTAKHQTAMRLDEKGFHERIAAIEEIDLKRPESSWNYNPKDYLQGYFQDALILSRRQNMPVMLQSAWQPITLLPRTQEVWLKADDSELSFFAGIKLKHKTIDSKISFTAVDPATMNLTVALDKFQTMEAFLWKLACWASKGRFPQAINVDQPVCLKYWPNFTRLLITPHALRIAALLIKGPRNMSNIARVLNIKPQYVYVFISAAYAVGLVSQAKRQSDLLVQPQATMSNKTQGLLARIMSKLRK
jgi:hypothetical protein